MSDDLTVMGIAATAAAAMGPEQIVLAHQAEHPLAGNPDVATDPKPSRPCGSPRPPRAMPPGRLRSPPAAPGPRSRASVPDALPAAARRAGRRSWRRTTGAGHAPGGADPPQAVGQTRAGRGGGTHRRDLPPPQRAEGLRSWPPAVPPDGQLSDPLHGAIQFRLHRIALALLERGVDPAGRFLTPLLEPEDLYAQLARQKLHRLVTQKPQNTSRLRATVHRWPSPSGPARKAWPGENVDEPSSPGPQAHQQQLSSQNYRIDVPVLLGHFD